MTYRYVNTALESVSLLICIVLLLYQFKEQKSNKKSSKSNHWFLSMVVFNMAMLIGDLCAWILGGYPGKLSYIVQHIFEIEIYFSSGGLLLFSLFGWVISNVKQKTTISEHWMRIGILLTAMQVFLAFTMPFHKICYIDENNVYGRGSYFILTQIFPYIVYFMAIYLLFSYRKAFRQDERICISIFVIIPMIAEIIQVFTYKYMTLNVAVSIGLVMIHTFIQAQRELENEHRMNELIKQENRKLEELQIFQENLSEQLIEVLCSTVEAKDLYMRGHSLRVAQYAREIMYRLGGDEQARREIYYIGVLHDVGKIIVHDDIINKKGSLDTDEYEQMKLHTIAGYHLLRGVDAIPNLAQGARWHHERYDGTGYPNGLAGEDIPLVARIISVADAYDAMTSNRSYHNIRPQSEVREQIEKGKGTQFDPRIAQIMLDMIDEDLQYDMKQISFGKTINILVADENPEVHTLVQSALIDENYILTSAYSGKEAIASLQEFKYDLCLIQMDMEDMSGFEVMEWIRNNIHKLKIIALTGKKDIELIKKCEELGAKDCVTKPINPAILVECIENVLIR